MELLDPQLQPAATAAPAPRKQVNLKKEILRYLRLWPWVVLCMVVFYTVAKIYLRYAQPQFLSKTSLMISESKNKNNTALSDLKNLGMGVSGDNELQGETVVIVSKPILTQVARNLNLGVSYYSVGTIKETELYRDTPVEARFVENTTAPVVPALIVIAPAGAGKYKISEGPGSGNTYAFGQPVMLPFGQVVISLNRGSRLVSPVQIKFRSLSSAVSELENGISVSLPENKGLLMELSLVGSVPEKSRNILDEVVHQYNIEGLKDKNQEAENTQDFINGRLDIISGDLSGIETEKENFKRSNQITDLQTQANLALNNANDNTKQLLAYRTQLDLVNSIYGLSNTERLLPSNMGLSTVTEGYIARYNDLLLTRNKTLKQATGQNPAVIDLNKQVSELRSLIRQNLAESREALNIQIGQVQGRLQAEKGQIDRYPTQEKVFRNIDRNQQLKEQLYLYLLQKREENAITLAVKVPKSKVINPAYTLGQVKPNTKMITNGALAAGFILPLLIFFVGSLLDTKVRTKQQLTDQMPNVPVLAEIPVAEKDQLLVGENDFSVYAEAFRILSSNLKYMIRARSENGKGTILVTSSVKGEGKTTVAMNTAVTLSGKSRVLLLGADIRNPQLHRYINKRNVGLTDYLISVDLNPEKYVHASGLHTNLDVMFSGAIAPNPNDLLDMKKFDELILWAREHYDYVVMDSAPVMLVRDSLHLVDLADTVLYVVKSGVTDKDMLVFTEEFRRNNNIRTMAFVLNNVKPEYTRYGRKYGYGYYADPAEKKSFFRRIF